MKKFLPLVLTCIFTFFAVVAKSQNVDLLTSSDQNRISRADKKIEKAYQIANKKEKYTSQIEANEGASPRKIEKLEKKANREVIKSASYYKEGYAKKYKAYKKAVNRKIKSNSVEGEVQKYKKHATTAYKNGRKWRRKSASQSDVNKAVDYLLKANGSEADAIKSLAKVLEEAKPKEELLVQEPEPADTLVAVPDTTANVVMAPIVELAVEDTLSAAIDSTALTTSTDSVAMDSELAIMVPVVAEEVAVEEPATPEELTLYFSVQFLADKQPVPKEKINAIYDGPFEVVKHESDGWYRYSFGKFETIEEAKSMMTKSGVKGYVVAYHNEQRISTRKATEMLSVQ